MKFVTNIFRWALLAINLLALLIWLLASSALWINPSYIVIPSILAIGYEWIAIANLAVSIVWLFTSHKKYILIFFVGFLFSLPANKNTCRLYSKKQPQTNHSIKVMTYNTLCLGKAMNKDQHLILNFIKNQDADIVFLQEIRTSKSKGQYYLTLEQVKEELGYEYSYIDFKFFEGEHRYGMALFSKYPLINKRTIRYESDYNQSDCCDVVIGTDTLRLINNHLESNRLTQSDLAVPHIQSEELKESADHITKKLSIAYPIRINQARKIRQEIKQSPYPVIVAGDFNDVPVSYLYRTISNDLEDSFLESCPRQLGHTFIKHHLGIRIDYILHSKSIYAKRFRVLHSPYSDHNPIITELWW